MKKQTASLMELALEIPQKKTREKIAGLVSACLNSHSSLVSSTWVWLKIKQGGLRRFWSRFPLTRVPFWNSGFLSHSSAQHQTNPASSLSTAPMATSAWPSESNTRANRRALGLDGRNPFRATWKPRATIVCHLQKTIIIPGLLRWCETDFVHPQQVGNAKWNEPRGPLGRSTSHSPRTSKVGKPFQNSQKGPLDEIIHRSASLIEPGGLVG